MQNIVFLITEKDDTQYYVSDLYWFEENGVHDFSGEGNSQDFQIKMITDYPEENLGSVNCYSHGKEPVESK
jgi:hypothetical protein